MPDVLMLGLEASVTDVSVIRGTLNGMGFRAFREG